MTCPETHLTFHFTGFEVMYRHQNNNIYLFPGPLFGFLNVTQNVVPSSLGSARSRRFAEMFHIEVLVLFSLQVKEQQN